VGHAYAGHPSGALFSEHNVRSFFYRPHRIRAVQTRRPQGEESGNRHFVPACALSWQGNGLDPDTVMGARKLGKLSMTIAWQTEPAQPSSATSGARGAYPVSLIPHGADARMDVQS